MFCPQCGKQIEPGSRFCPACGHSVAPAETQGYTSYPFQRTAQLTRPREGRMIAGVCAGFAQHYGWDLNLVRILTVVIILMTGVGALAYLAAWVIIPEAPYALPAKST
jgi:phage shock protein C